MTSVDCTEQVTAGRIVRSGRQAPSRARAARLGVCLADELAGQPDDVEDERPVHGVRSGRAGGAAAAPAGQSPGWPARPGAPLTRGAWPRRTELPSNSWLWSMAGPPRAPRDPAGRSGRRTRTGLSQTMRSDVGLRDPALAHERDRLRHLEGIAHAPVGRAVDEDPLGAVALHQRDHARLVHLRVGVDRVAGPAAGLQHERQRLLGVVVDEHALLREADVADEGEGPLGAALLVAVRRVDQHRQVEAQGQLELGREVLLLGRRLVVEADLADRDDAVLLEVARQELDHARRDPPVVRLLRVQRQRAEVAHAELARPEALPAEQRR